MARAKKTLPSPAARDAEGERLGDEAESISIPGVQGPGRWLIAEFKPTALFSLKISLATSSVGKSLVVPTPYSIKMAFVDATFRVGWTDAECAAFLRSLVGVGVRVAPPKAACVTHTFVKVRQESRDADPLRPYIASIAYREVVHHHGLWRWAFDLASGNKGLGPRLVVLAPHVTYIGKRGSFVQFAGISRLSDLGLEFTRPVLSQESWVLPQRAHIVPLDDFGPDADLETLSSFTSKAPKRDKHRHTVETVVPLGLVNTGPGFSEYRGE